MAKFVTSQKYELPPPRPMELSKVVPIGRSSIDYNSLKKKEGPGVIVFDNSPKAPKKYDEDFYCTTI